MGLMKAMRGVATGYLGARVDMMAADAKKKREDEIRAAEEAHDLNKLNDKYNKDTFHNEYKKISQHRDRGSTTRVATVCWNALPRNYAE